MLGIDTPSTLLGVALQWVAGSILVRAAGPDGAPRQVGTPDVPVDDWTEFQNAPDDSPRSIFASLRCRSRFLHLVETAIVSVEENSTFIASNTPLLRSRLPKFAGRTNCWVFLLVFRSCFCLLSRVLNSSCFSPSNSRLDYGFGCSSFHSQRFSRDHFFLQIMIEYEGYDTRFFSRFPPFCG